MILILGTETYSIPLSISGYRVLFKVGEAAVSPEAVPLTETVTGGADRTEKGLLPGDRELCQRRCWSQGLVGSPRPGSGSTGGTVTGREQHEPPPRSFCGCLTSGVSPGCAVDLGGLEALWQMAFPKDGCASITYPTAHLTSDLHRSPFSDRLCALSLETTEQGRKAGR